MRRMLLALAMVVGILPLAGCGNKGPLVRASTTGNVAPAGSSIAPAHPGSVP